MIVDSSAILAILFNESDTESYVQATTDADACRISAANFVEVAIVVEAQTKATGSRQLRRATYGNWSKAKRRAAGLLL
jgi:ribonuclease VapC